MTIQQDFVIRQGGTFRYRFRRALNQQTLEFSGALTAGTFQLGLNGALTTAIDIGDRAALVIQNALNAMPYGPTGGFLVSGSGESYVVSFAGDGAKEKQALLTKIIAFDGDIAVARLGVDMTGWTARLMVRESYSAPAPVISITQVMNSDGQVIMSAAADGWVELYIKDTATDGLTIFNAAYVYDLELVDPDSVPADDVLVYLAGKMTVKPSVTHG